MAGAVRPHMHLIKIRISSGDWQGIGERGSAKRGEAHGTGSFMLETRMNFTRILLDTAVSS